MSAYVLTALKPNPICQNRKYSFFSGLHVTYDMKQAAGSRVQSVTVQCAKCLLPSYEPIDEGKQYRVIASKYVINGGDEYTMIKNELIDAIPLSEYPQHCIRRTRLFGITDSHRVFFLHTSNTNVRIFMETVRGG